MELTLIRNPKPTHTPGELFIDGVKFCYTLEHAVRDKKIAGVTAIPAGTYRVTYEMSSRFKTTLPTLIDVPGFAGIRIHAGNSINDTLGCILVGTMRGNFDHSLIQSRSALEALRIRIAGAYQAGEPITITIR